MQYNTVPYNIVQYNQYNTIQCNTIQYKTLQYNIIWYDTVKYYTICHISVLCSKQRKPLCKTLYSWYKFGNEKNISWPNREILAPKLSEK